MTGLQLLKAREKGHCLFRAQIQLDVEWFLGGVKLKEESNFRSILRQCQSDQLYSVSLFGHRRQNSQLRLLGDVEPVRPSIGQAFANDALRQNVGASHILDAKGRAV